MARPDIKAYAPNLDAIWQCPCGFTAEYRYLPGHRRGKNPDCVGKIRQALPGWKITYGPHEGWITGDDGYARLPEQPKEPPSPPSQPTQEAPPVEAYEFKGDEGFLDPEEVARRLNLARQQGDTSEGAELRDDGSLPPTEIEPGDYFLEPPVSQPQVSTLPEKVTLPVIVRVMYDWAKSKGWNKGDGSLSAFVTDVLLDYWNNCMGMIVLVAKRDEIGLDGPWLEERALASAPTGNGKPNIDK